VTSTKEQTTRFVPPKVFLQTRSLPDETMTPPTCKGWNTKTGWIEARLPKSISWWSHYNPSCSCQRYDSEHQGNSSKNCYYQPG